MQTRASDERLAPAPDRTVPRVPLLHKLLYGMGYLTVALTTDMTLTWILKRYRPDPTDTRWNVLVSAGALFAAMFVGRLVDAVADPLVGFWSDRVRTRWGRRKPFILIGGPLLALMFVLIWIPPLGTESLLNAVYLAVTASLFFFCFTLVVCPYLAMLPEITDDPAERVSLTVWQGAFNVIGAVGGMALAGYLIDHYGYLTMALCFAPAVLLCSWTPLAVPTPAAGAAPSDFPLMTAIATTLRNPFFLPYVVSQLLFWVALRIVLAAGPKLVEVRAQVAETQQGMAMAAALLVAAVFFPFMRGFAARAGKKRLLMGAMAYFGLVMIPLIFLGRLPLPLSAYGQAILVMAFAGPAIAALFTLPNAMVADIVDRDEEQTGQRREAIYFGVQGLLVKAGMGLGIGVAALELERFGETAARQGGFVACPLTAMVLTWLAAAVLTRYRGD